VASSSTATATQHPRGNQQRRLTCPCRLVAGCGEADRVKAAGSRLQQTHIQRRSARGRGEFGCSCPCWVGAAVMYNATQRLQYIWDRGYKRGRYGPGVWSLYRTYLSSQAVPSWVREYEANLDGGMFQVTWIPTKCMHVGCSGRATTSHDLCNLHVCNLPVTCALVQHHSLGTPRSVKQSIQSVPSMPQPCSCAW
jgi:hypothetical protein